MDISAFLSKDLASVWSSQPEWTKETRQKIRNELEVGCTLLTHATTKLVLAHNHGADKKESFQHIESSVKYLILTIESIHARGHFLQRELKSKIQFAFSSLQKLVDNLKPSNASHLSHESSTGLLWKAFDGLKTVSLTDSAACRKVLQIQLDSLKDAHEEWIEYEKDPEHPLTLMIKQAISKVRQLIKDMAQEETNNAAYDDMCHTAKKLAAEVDDAVVEAMDNNDPEAYQLVTDLVRKLTLGIHEE